MHGARKSFALPTDVQFIGWLLPVTLTPGPSGDRKAILALPLPQAVGFYVATKKVHGPIRILGIVSRHD